MGALTVIIVVTIVLVALAAIAVPLIVAVVKSRDKTPPPVPPVKTVGPPPKAGGSGSGSGCKNCGDKKKAAAAAPATVSIIPTDVGTRIENSDPSWRFAHADNGLVSFKVQKNSGLVVALTERPNGGIPQDGYVVVLDRRGSDAGDAKTSMSYVAKATDPESPINSQMVRNVELNGEVHSVEVGYQHGTTTVSVDGKQILSASDSYARPGIAYVSFGHTGLRSGPGSIRDLVVQ